MLCMGATEHKSKWDYSNRFLACSCGEEDFCTLGTGTFVMSTTTPSPNLIFLAHAHIHTSAHTRPLPTVCAINLIPGSAKKVVHRPQKSHPLPLFLYASGVSATLTFHHPKPLHSLSSLLLLVFTYHPDTVEDRKWPAFAFQCMLFQRRSIRQTNFINTT